MKSLQKHDFSVATCFIEYDGKILLLQRAKKDSQFKLWGIPGGKLEISEQPIDALVREIKEELGLSVKKSEIEFLHSTSMKNKCDGSYQLYIYFLKLDTLPLITINQLEHLNYQWTTLENFSSYPLLFCQGIAFDLVKKKLNNKFIQEEKQLCLTSTS